MIMMIMIERSECDDDDDVLLEISTYDDDVADVADRKIRI